MKTIGLTSPHTTGGNVKRVQTLLKTNWTHKDYLQGPVDSIFGPSTARACARAKYWLGYPPTQQQKFAGDKLVALLSDEKNLSASYKTRRAARIKATQQKPLRAKALARAEKDLGMKESPKGSNECPISAKWGVTGPWCAMAVSEWYIAAGSKAFVLGRDWAYVPWLLQAAAAGDRNLSLIVRDLAEPGDIVCFDWDDDGVADHAGLLRSTVPPVGKFETIEGNTAVGNDSNGGEVMHRTRELSDVMKFSGQLAFIRVNR